MSDDLDIARIGYILKNFDSVDYARDEDGNIAKTWDVRGKGNQPASMVIYKLTTDDMYIAVQAVADNNYKKLWIKSAYQVKKRCYASDQCSDN